MKTTIPIPKKLRETTTYEADGKTLEVTKIRAARYDRSIPAHIDAVYFARVVGQERARFGDADQIREDIANFLEMGNLPYSKNSWA